MTLLSVVVAVAAAVSFGWSTALMHHSASAASPDLHGPVALLRHLVVQWRWLVGMAASLLGFVLHAVALHLGSIALVQPVIVSGLVWSLVFRAALDRRLLPRSMLGAVLLTATGLVVFVVSFRTSAGDNSVDGRAAAVLLACGGAAAALALWLSFDAGARRRGLLLGASGGIVFGLIAGAIKATTDSAARQPVWQTWPVYVLVALGACGFLLNQRAYHQTSLSSSLPALNLLNPVVAVVFGVVAFHERPTGGPLALTAQGASLLAVLLGIFLLSRRPDRDVPVPV
ncbi:hypothetical protein CLV35_2552 [Motilibacter peucedani]|uniref:Magnesium transporter NIPA n=1 Tax=Motilibacter peucedani TaxID=598650 RepID=A0A420XPD3_9ACTN|nr:DMT family transporter [Motilibacter peucedani]RKS74053.1 hypothetical protein CLV35_2552 [Motilibacter peucedani]